LTSRIIAVRSYRRGTGKTTITANLAAQLAVDGYRVGIAEVDFEISGIQFAFGLGDQALTPTLYDYLKHRCQLEETFLPVGQHMPADSEYLYRLENKPLWLAPATYLPPWRRADQPDHTHFAELYRGLTQTIGRLHLDYLFLDMNSGLIDDNALYGYAFADLALVILQPDQQDYQGTGILLAVLNALEMPNISIVINKVPSKYNPVQVEQEMYSVFQVPSMTVLPFVDHGFVGPHDDWLLTLREPDDAWSKQIQSMARRLPNMIDHEESGHSPSLSSLRSKITGREPGLIKKVLGGFKHGD